MADVTGPISSLPNSRHASPKGAMCDDHPDRPAVGRVQGETDSFGSEMHDLCQECIDQHRAYVCSEESRSGVCDWCKEAATDLRSARDYDEGMCGPVYRICGGCAKRRDDEAREELEASGYYDDWGYDDE